MPEAGPASVVEFTGLAALVPELRAARLEQVPPQLLAPVDQALKQRSQATK